MTEEIIARLDRIESYLSTLAEEKTVKEFYSTAEVAEVLNKAEFTVREWCRNGRGKSKEWIISHDELQRIRNEGLLPN